MSITVIATSSAAYVRQAIAELRTLDRELGAIRPIAPGVLRCLFSLDRAHFFERVRAPEPVFIRHVQPADINLALHGTAADLAALSDAVGRLLESVRPEERIAVHVRRFGEAGGLDRQALREQIEPLIFSAGGQPVKREADRILSVLLEPSAAYLGLSSPAENLSDWPGGEVRFRREADQLSRAEFKLLEAFERFDLGVPAGGSVLDLGAAPGGWTSLLLERGLRVTAVDTGEMGEAVRNHPCLEFLRRNVHEVSFPPDSFDLLTCDMSWNPLRTAREVTRLAPALRPGAHLVLTVKLMLENPTATIRRVGELLTGEFRLLQVKQLFHNRDEVTMHLARK